VTCDRSVVFSGPQVSSTNTTSPHDIAEILLKVALSNIKPNHKYFDKSLKIPKWQSDAVNRRTDNTMTKGKRTKRQTMI
jgi:hypothetical protein